MARRKQCQDLSNTRGQDTLMPVSPKDNSVEEGLSRDGDTADGVGRGEEKDQEDEGGEAEEEGEEVRVPLGKRSPKDPTQRQREEHERTHLAYRSWCEDCVRPRARNAPHHKKAAQDPSRRSRYQGYTWIISSCPARTRQLAAIRC